MLGVWAEIGSGHLPNTMQKHYSWEVATSNLSSDTEHFDLGLIYSYL